MIAQKYISTKKKQQPNTHPDMLVPDTIVLVVRKIRDVDTLLMLASTCKAIRAVVWTPLIARPTFFLNSQMLTFLKDAKRHLSHGASITHESHRHCRPNSKYSVVEHSARITHEGRVLLSVTFLMGDNSVDLEFHSDKTGYFVIFPESGHIEYRNRRDVECHEYNPPHLLAKLVEMKLV